MTFAGNYLLKQDFSPTINTAPNTDCGIIIVIPCFNEPDLLLTINSIYNCEYPGCFAEIIVVINSSVNATKSELEQNKTSNREISNWKKTHQNKHIGIYTINKKGITKKLSGAGFARKIGMDEATHRFNAINKPDGIIVSLDADCLCDKNYLSEIKKLYINKPKANACTIYFEHPIEGTDFQRPVYSAITQYELYLRYYVRALKTINFPYAIHTIGSCFSIKANIYAKQGGMNKKNAGEDFYFLQKIIPLGNFYELNTTRVVPSPRPSLRVPFGTGPVIDKFLKKEIKEILTYSLKSFFDLNLFFDNINKLYNTNIEGIEAFVKEQPKSISDYLNSIDFNNIICDANNNSSSLSSFKKRFYSHFNAFRVLKYLNFAHQTHYKLHPVKDVAIALLKNLNYCPIPKTTNELLLIFRKLDKSIINVVKEF